MSENKIGVSPDRVFGLQKDYSEKAHIAMNQNDEQFFNSFEAFLKADYNQKNELIEKVLGIKSEVLNFKVCEVFGHRVKGLTPQYFGGNFKNWLWTSAQQKIVSIDKIGKSIIKDYVLPKNMNDTSIQNANNSTPLGEDAFWAMMYLLIINPKLGKKILKYSLKKDKVYICHVQLTGRVVAVYVVWGDDEWYFSALDFVSIDPWLEGSVFLRLATS